MSEVVLGSTRPSRTPKSCRERCNKKQEIEKRAKKGLLETIPNHDLRVSNDKTCAPTCLFSYYPS
jgi:hypothetical protein